MRLLINARPAPNESAVDKPPNVNNPHNAVLELNNNKGNDNTDNNSPVIKEIILDRLRSWVFCFSINIDITAVAMDKNTAKQ